jgi:SecD/SecF fusion protein
MMRENVYNFLGIRQYTYREAKEREINLGLDLRGGMNVTLEISTYEIIRALSNYSDDPTFVEALNWPVNTREPAPKISSPFSGGHFRK